MPMAEDYADFLNVDEHAHQAVLDHVAVVGIFDNGHRDALAALAGGIAVQAPSFALPSSDCTRTRAGVSQIRIVGEGTYIVTAIEPDGTGMTVLRLQLAR